MNYILAARLTISGSKELIVQHFSDGAHRSYIFNLFKKIDESNYIEIISRENVIVTEDSIYAFGYTVNLDFIVVVMAVMLKRQNTLKRLLI